MANFARHSLGSMMRATRARLRIRSLLAALLFAAAANLLWAATDADFEKAAGLDKALAANPPTMSKDGELEGKVIEVDNAFGQAGCKAKFEFVTAKTGTYPFAALAKRGVIKTVKGVYVKISGTFDKTKCEGRCEQVKILQVTRGYAKNASGGTESVSPPDEERQKKAGWDKPNAPSRGWLVDARGKSPFYGAEAVAGSIENGSTDTPVVERDAPGNWDDTVKQGKEFLTCAVCANAGQKSRIIGCVTWGFYTDAAGKVAFEPKPPSPSSAASQQFKDALDRFENIAGNNSANLQF